MNFRFLTLNDIVERFRLDCLQQQEETAELFRQEISLLSHRLAAARNTDTKSAADNESPAIAANDADIDKDDEEVATDRQSSSKSMSMSLLSSMAADRQLRARKHSATVSRPLSITLTSMPMTDVPRSSISANKNDQSDKINDEFDNAITNDPRVTDKRPTKRPRITARIKDESTNRPRSNGETLADVRAGVVKAGARLKDPDANFNQGTKIKCICKNDHEIRILSRSILRYGFFCKFCADESRCRLQEDKIRVLVERFGGLAKLTGRYVNNYTKIDCICSVGHRCSPWPLTVLSGGAICKDCGVMAITAASRRLAAVKWTDRLTKKRFRIIGKYVDNRTPIQAICPIGHDCWPVPRQVHLGRAICNACDESVGRKGESRFGDLLRQLSQHVRKEFTIPNSDNKWRFDFIIGKILFEFDGPQHFRACFGADAFAKQRPTDLAKMRLAFAKGFRVIRVHYEWIYKKETDQIAWLRAAMASAEQLIVSSLVRYDWTAKTDVEPSEPK